MLLHSSSDAPSRRAVVLLAVLVIVVLLSLAAYKYNDYMLSEYRAANSSLRATQARAFADSGVHYAAAMLTDIDTNLNGNPWNNPSLFQGIQIAGSDKKGGGRFTVLAISSPDDLTQGNQPYRLGVIDEGGKINLNALLALDNGKGDLGMQLLMGLPNMTQDIANAILDWLDPDETPRTNGAESDYYQSQNPPYQCKNGPLDSLEELLLVKGVTAQLLFGNDRNRNGVLDPDEDDGSGQLDQGWSAYLTVYSREANVDSTGNGRIYLNDGDLNTLKQNLTTAELSPDLVNFILAYRLYGGSQITTKGGAKGATGNPGAVSAQIQSDLASASTRKLNNIQSLWDLVNSQVSVTMGKSGGGGGGGKGGKGGGGGGGGSQSATLPSPLNDPSQQTQMLPILLDKCTTMSSGDLSPRINVNTAPQAVLTALQQVVTKLQDSDVQTIMTTRPQTSDGTAPDPIFKTTAWLLTKANLPVATIKQLDTYLTAKSQVYRVQSVGYFDEAGPSARVEAVIDTNQGRPRIVYLRDLTELGRGFDLDALRGSNSNGN